MAKSTGLGLLELPTAFDRLQPDVVITVGDRFETMATALAATYMNIPLAHTMGGEVSGNIDESIRHAVTKFAHVHFPASKGAAERIVKLGEDPENVHMVGCPRMDLVAETLAEDGDGLSELFRFGVGGSFSLDEPFLLVSQHPVTTEYGDGERQITETLKAVQDGVIYATIVQRPFQFGYQSMKALKDVRDGKTIPTFIDTTIQKIDKNNLATFWAELRELKK